MKPRALGSRSSRFRFPAKSRGPIIKPVILVGIVVAALIGAFAIMAVLYAAYDKCGHLCWQGLFQAQRERY
jgi:hypothetical protein